MSNLESGVIGSISCLSFFLGVIVSCFVFCPPFNFESHYELETLCNQLHDTNSCSVVYKNDDVVLFDTYNGYVTMENILK